MYHLIWKWNNKKLFAHRHITELTNKKADLTWAATNSSRADVITWSMVEGSDADGALSLSLTWVTDKAASGAAAADFYNISTLMSQADCRVNSHQKCFTFLYPAALFHFHTHPHTPSSSLYFQSCGTMSLHRALHELRGEKYIQINCFQVN